MDFKYLRLITNFMYKGAVAKLQLSVFSKLAWN